MRMSPLNMISTAMPVLNTLGLNLRVGLSSEDPMVGKRLSGSYEVYLSIYSPEGLLLDRPHLGQIPPERRRYFDVSSITRNLVPQLDHLTVVHRIPTSLAQQLSSVEEEIDLPEEPDYSLVRSLVEYSFPGGGNGSIIYETPPWLNSRPSSNTLSFTCQIILSELLDSHVVLINHSVDPSYSRIANYGFGVYSLAGEQVSRGNVLICPFGIKVLDMSQLIPEKIRVGETDSIDRLAAFTFVGYSNDAALLTMTLNVSQTLGAVAVEHTHPPQAYLFPLHRRQPRVVKADAQQAWESILSRGSVT